MSKQICEFCGREDNVGLVDFKSTCCYCLSDGYNFENILPVDFVSYEAVAYGTSTLAGKVVIEYIRDNEQYIARLGIHIFNDKNGMAVFRQWCIKNGYTTITNLMSPSAFEEYVEVIL